MFLNSQASRPFTWPKRLSSLLLLGLLCLIPLTSFAADGAVRTTKVHGELDKGYSKHYLAIEPDQRDTIVTLTLHIEPQDQRRVNNKVNLLLLTADDLRRVQAGDKPEDLAFGMGMPAVVDHDGSPKQMFNKTATLKASGKGVYTVIVYSRAPIPTSYTLTAENAKIVDESGQVTAAD